MGFSVVGDEYDSPVTFPLRLMDEPLQMTDPFLGPAASIDVVVNMSAWPEEADEDVDAPVLARCSDVDLFPLPHPHRS